MNSSKQICFVPSASSPNRIITALDMDSKRTKYDENALNKNNKRTKD
jgi:hypothetical protein